MSAEGGPVSLDSDRFRGTYTSLVTEMSELPKCACKKEVNGYQRFHLTGFAREE